MREQEEGYYFNAVLYLFCSKVLEEIRASKICGTTDWCRNATGECRHCLRLLFTRITIDGYVHRRKTSRVNFVRERQKIFRWYRGRRVLISMLRLERRVLRSLGIRT